MCIFVHTYARKMEENKLGYAEFNENLMYMSDFSQEFLEGNDALLKDLSYSLWEDYSSNSLFIRDYVKILNLCLDKLYIYGIQW